jgi:hypothetical protein
MTSRLSSEALNQLTPLLGSLARLVARGSQVSEAQLRTLLLGADLESEPAALEELNLHSALLNEGLGNKANRIVMLGQRAQNGTF